MASCAITIGGTSGSVLIRYTLGASKNSITAAFGSEIFISDTATDITYTTLSGDATASSGCVTITELEEACYEFKWETYKFGCDRGDVINAVIVGTTIIPLTSKSVSASFQTIGEVIDEADESVILPYAGKFVSGTSGTGRNYLKVKIYGSDTYTALRVHNADSGFYYYIVGESTTCTAPAGYSTIDACPAPEISI